MVSYWAGKTVLVSGGMGFVGSHFVEELLAQGARVACAYRTPRDDVAEWLPSSLRLRMLKFDLLDQRELEAVFRYAEQGIDTVIQCAAIDGNAAFKAANPASIMDDNLRITSNVLDCARRFAVPDVVLLSSAEVYIGACDGPIREQDDRRSLIRQSGNGYVLSKIFTEILAELYREQFGMRIYLPRLANVYGSRDNFAGTNSRIIPRLLAGTAAGQEVEIWGDGSQTRTFIHVLDVVRTTLRVVETSAYQTFNVGTVEAVSMLKLARLVAEALQERSRIRLMPDKPVGPSSRELDLTLMNKVIDFAPISLRDGLSDTASWYMRQRSAKPCTPDT